MTIFKKRASNSDSKGFNGLYIHSNPPRILSVSAAHIKQLIRNGDIERLEQLVVDGQGKKLVGEYSADYKTRMFLKSVPALMSKVSLLHDSLNSDRLAELQSILDEEPERKRKLVLAKDDSGVGLLHKAVYYDLKSIYRWLIDKFSHTVHQRDSEGRTPYFYTLMCKEPAAVQKLLTVAGADPNIQDYRGHSTKYYSNHLQELELPSGTKSSIASRKSTANKESLIFKKSNIRIWIHQRNMANLQQVVWDGHGSKLLVEHSNNAKMRKFLEAVPYIMGLIKDVHCDAQNGDLDSLKNRIASPVPIAILTSKDGNGLTPLHKAVGLGKEEIARYIVDQVPGSVNIADNEGKTPLHYAALLKDDQKMFNFLIEHGADESALDMRQKTAAYYKTRAFEVDSKVLNVIPDCPRGAKEPTSFDWAMLTAVAPINGLSRKSVEKIENGVKDKLATNSDSSRSKDEPAEDEEKANEQEEEMSVEEPTKSLAEPPSEPTTNDNNMAAESEKSIEVLAAENDEIETVAESPNAEKEEGEEKEKLAEPEQNEEVGKQDEESEDKNEGDNNNNMLNNKEDDNPSKDLENDFKDDIIETETKEIENSQLATPGVGDSSSKPSTASQSRPASKTLESSPKTEEVEQQEKAVEAEIEKKSEPEIEGEGVIEGIVNGEDQVEPVNNEGPNRPSTMDNDVKTMIQSGNMEQLAALVLNGEGDKLVGEKSDNPELQTFLDNVPVYMSKISRIHTAAREGSLRDLQAALDRRKFATAREKASTNGASPLHIAVAFGRTSVVRYLAGRFPETLHVEDDNGRTPLHYAAVLRDNGHYYNLLTHLGADNRIKDKFGRTPVYYTKIQNEFNHRLILKDFGVEQEAEAEQFVHDKEPADSWSARKLLDDQDMISVLDRCFAVLHGGKRNLNSISATSEKPFNNNNNVSGIMSKQVKRYTYDSVKLKITKLDHNLYDIIWPSVKKLPADPALRTALEEDFPLGIVVPDFYVYKVFEDFLNPILKEYNFIDVNKKLGLHPSSEFSSSNETDFDLNLDPSGRLLINEPQINVVGSDDNDGQIDMPFFATEEGRYLASSLGDPLIKGLTEVANKRPADPIAYLATYLYNFAHSRDGPKSRGRVQDGQLQKVIANNSGATNENKTVPASIDVVTVEPDDNNIEEDSAFNSTSRDEHGQSMLHFAAARSHSRNALYQLLLETEINVAFRDELYRTARDISIQANLPENTVEIDRYVLNIATKGDTSKLVELLLDGYDHITDIADEKDSSIIDIVSNAGQSETVSFLQSILAFEEKRERVHHAIRQGSLNDVMTLLADENDTGSGKLLAIGKNAYGRCSMHIAVLCQQEEIVDYLANTFVDTLRIGDNLERTALHYAMGVDKMETITRVLIKAGAKRVVKDLKGRQPTYYFLNKTDILRLQEEEETF